MRRVFESSVLAAAILSAAALGQNQNDDCEVLIAAKNQELEQIATASDTRADTIADLMGRIAVAQTQLRSVVERTSTNTEGMASASQTEAYQEAQIDKLTIRYDELVLTVNGLLSDFSDVKLVADGKYKTDLDELNRLTKLYDDTEAQIAANAVDIGLLDTRINTDLANRIAAIDSAGVSGDQIALTSSVSDNTSELSDLSDTALNLSNISQDRTLSDYYEINTLQKSLRNEPENLAEFCVDSDTTVEIFVSLTLERAPGNMFSWLDTLSIKRDGTEQVSVNNNGAHTSELTDTFTLFLKQTNAGAPANYVIQADPRLRSTADDPLIKANSFQWGAKVYKDFYELAAAKTTC